jgi:hypothetical protein
MRKRKPAAAARMQPPHAALLGPGASSAPQEGSSTGRGPFAPPPPKPVQAFNPAAAVTGDGVVLSSTGAGLALAPSCTTSQPGRRATTMTARERKPAARQAVWGAARSKDATASRPDKKKRPTPAERRAAVAASNAAALAGKAVEMPPLAPPALNTALPTEADRAGTPSVQHDGGLNNTGVFPPLLGSMEGQGQGRVQGSGQSVEAQPTPPLSSRESTPPPPGTGTSQWMQWAPPPSNAGGGGASSSHADDALRRELACLGSGGLQAAAAAEGSKQQGTPSAEDRALDQGCNPAAITQASAQPSMFHAHSSTAAGSTALWGGGGNMLPTGGNGAFADI